MGGSSGGGGGGLVEAAKAAKLALWTRGDEAPLIAD